VVNVS